MIDLIYSWGNIDNDCNMLASVITNNTTMPERVIALGNDLVPAALVASRLDLPVIQITDTNNLPLISDPITSGDGTLPDLPKLLFVVSYVSVANYGDINELAARFLQVGHEISIGALFSSQGPPHTFQYQTYVSSGTHITFPWKL